MSKKESRGSRVWGVLLLLVILTAAFLYLRFGADFGFGRARDFVEEKSEDSETKRAEPTPKPGNTETNDAGPSRCTLRLSAEGLSVNGQAASVEPVNVEAAIEECKQSGRAELVVTGDAEYGLRQKLRQALLDAEIEVFEK